MPERSSKRQTPKDPNKLVAYIVKAATNDANEKNPHAVALGRLGGKRGGVARAKKLTAKQRSDIARNAARARWEQSENKT